LESLEPPPRGGRPARASGMSAGSAAAGFPHPAGRRFREATGRQFCRQDADSTWAAALPGSGLVQPARPDAGAQAAAAGSLAI